MCPKGKHRGLQKRPMVDEEGIDMPVVPWDLSPTNILHAFLSAALSAKTRGSVRGLF